MPAGARDLVSTRTIRVASAGHAVFAAIAIALGSIGALRGEFTPVWSPVPEHVPARQLLVYLCAIVFVACGIGLLWRRLAAAAAGALLGYLVIWLLVFRVHVILRAPGSFGSWDDCAETAVIVAGAWILYAWFAGARDRSRLGFVTGARGVRIARVLYGLAMISFGLAHFIYLRETAVLVPHWLPARLAWAAVTGGAFLAAGAAVLTGAVARLAAALSTLQMGLFTVLVWIPIVAVGPAGDFPWHELGISAALTGAGWVVADSYRDTPWLAVRFLR